MKVKNPESVELDETTQKMLSLVDGISNSDVFVIVRRIIAKRIIENSEKTAYALSSDGRSLDGKNVQALHAETIRLNTIMYWDQYIKDLIVEDSLRLADAERIIEEELEKPRQQTRVERLTSAARQERYDRKRAESI